MPSVCQTSSKQDNMLTPQKMPSHNQTSLMQEIPPQPQDMPSVYQTSSKEDVATIRNALSIPDLFKIRYSMESSEIAIIRTANNPI